METLGQRIRRLREAQGLSQADLAGDDLTRGYISQVENDQVTPSRLALDVIARRLGRPPGFFTHEPQERDVSVLRLMMRHARQLVRRKKWGAAAERLQEARSLAAEWGQEEIEGEIWSEMARLLAMQGRHREAADMYRQLLTSGLAMSGFQRARVKASIGYLLYRLGQNLDARQWLQQADQDLKGLSGAEARRLRTTTLLNLGHVCTRLELWDDALSACKGAVALAVHSGDAEREGLALLCEGAVRLQLAEYDRARAAFTQSLSIFQHQPAEQGNVMACVYNLAKISAKTGDAEGALIGYRRYRQFMHAAGNPVEEARAFIAEGEVYVERGDRAAAVRARDAAQSLLNQAHDPLIHVELLCLDGSLARLSGDETTARQRYHTALSVAKAHQWGQVCREIESLLGQPS